MLILEIILIALLVAAALSIVRIYLKTGISPMPSSGKALRAVLGSVEIKKEGHIIDLGSSWGILAAAFARKYPGHKVIGYELSTVPWLISIMLKRLSGLNNLFFYRRDFLETDLSEAVLLICYLSSDGMSILRRKLEEEGNREMVIVSNAFALPSCQPDRVIRLNDIYRTPIYVYRFP